MKNRVFLIVIAMLAIGAGVVFMRSQGDTPRHSDHSSAVVAPSVSHSEPAHTHSARVPAYQTASQIGQLAPTLPPSEFFGKAREAYLVAKAIPQTLAQLPCYCHCDQEFGHKSLHSCYVDNHASQCAVCVDEALLAYKLQKEQHLTPEQVREIIIEKYSAAQSEH